MLSAFGAGLGGGLGALAGDKIGRSAAMDFSGRCGTRDPESDSAATSTPTQLQKAERELSGSLFNARRYLAQEASLMHQ